MKQKILVTGASGFIGHAVCKKLVGKYNVVATVSPFSKPSRLRGLRTKLSTIKIDLSNFGGVEKLFKKYKPNIVLHLATHGVYQYQQQDEDRIVMDNYLITSNLLKASVEFGVEKFINTGSVFEYGSQSGKVKETDVDLTDILNKYSAVKMATTALANAYSEKLNVITLRPFTTYGPEEDMTRFFSATIRRALKSESIRIVKGVIRDFVFIDDVAEAYLKSIEKSFNSGEIINIASGDKSTLEETALLIKKLTKSRSEIIFDEKYIRNKESKCWADITKAKKVLKWHPEYSLAKGVKKTIDWIKNN